MHFSDAKNYRQFAKIACDQAKKELSGPDERLNHAALDLRLALEALVYERASAFKDVLGGVDSNFWQPQKILEKLVSLDEALEQPVKISVEMDKENAPGQFTELGTDVPITSKEIRKHYHALGNFLHAPTPDRFEAGTLPDANKIRKRCENSIALIEHHLAAKIWNIKAGFQVNLGDCPNSSCAGELLGWTPTGGKRAIVRCSACPAEFIAIQEGQEQAVEGSDWLETAFSLIPQSDKTKCQREGCEADIEIWLSQRFPGSVVECADCGQEHKLSRALAIQIE